MSFCLLNVNAECVRNKNPGLALGFFIYNEFMKNNLISALIKLVCILLLSFNVHSSDDVNDSLLQDDNDIMLMDEFSSCTDQYEIND